MLVLPAWRSARTNSGAVPAWTTLDSKATITFTELKAYFGLKVSGIVNTTKGGEESRPATRYLPGMKPNVLMPLSGGTNLYMLGLDLEGPEMLTAADGRKLTPFRYVSTNPTNNARTYDLWIDLKVGSKIERMALAVGEKAADVARHGGNPVENSGKRSDSAG